MISTGKSQSLERLINAGFKVPKFFVCEKDWSENRILEAIDRILPNVSYFAVRSSAKNEDSATQSFAGHYYSAIGVKHDDVYLKVQKVIESYKDLPGSVIVQEFIPSDRAGVTFSEVENDTVIINATVGLCQPVVNGEACDEYICNKRGSILRKDISAKKKTLLFKNNGLVTENSGNESLTEKEIQALIKLANEIQAIFESPQDIEWCIKDGEVYILQSRPITRNFTIGKKEYFDSANIAESYSGIVLPLTCSFAKMVYEQVYKDLLHMSGVSKVKIERHSEVFENLLGFFNGRMYYNMNNWYHMAEFVPGYKRNKKNFEVMITSNVSQSVPKHIQSSIILRASYPFIVGLKVIMFGLISARFRTSVEQHLSLLRKRDFNSLSYQDSITLFGDLNKNLLRRWYITLENDFFVMTYLGVLKKLLDEKTLQYAITFPSKATEQVNALSSLARTMSTNTRLWSAIKDDDVNIFGIELKKNPQISKELDEYLQTFGGRFANELKLESIGVDEDMEKLFAVLKAYKGYYTLSSDFDSDAMHVTHMHALLARQNKNFHPKPYANSVNIPVSFFKRIIISKFRKYSSRREEFRLLRSNTFGMARRLFRHMGKLLAESKIIERSDDVFYLQMSEILDPDTMANTGLKDIISKRKKEYASYEKIVLPSHFMSINGQTPKVVNPGDLEQQKLSARPASQGKVAGRVRVFREFSMPSQIDFEIMVTSHTDPGWTSLIALSKGLIIEHGGVLSHASIVARELGIPAVIGAENAVDILSNGQMVEIDGSAGTIKIL